MNILIINSNSFGYDDIIFLFKKMGHNVFTYDHPDISMHKNDTVFSELDHIIKKQDISLVFSYNYFPIVSYVLKETNVKYIAYVYDSPNIALYTCSIVFPCNYVFIFDYAVYEELRNGGISTVYYLPLAINIERINKTLSTSKKKHSYDYDVSFVGGLYNEEHTLYDRLYSKLKPEHDYVKGYLDSLINAQSKIYGYFFLEKMLDDNILSVLNEVYPYQSNQDSIATSAYVYAHYFMARKVTELERINLLNKISEKHNLTVFTYNDTPELPLAHNMGSADYYAKMPFVFNNSKINLNISLKSILTGIPLRCIDIMGCGGFLLTNYQADLLRHFEAGTHFDYYTDENDLLRKIEYYLTHEDERMSIAENAKKEIERSFNLEEYLKAMLENVI